ncbi:GNAT family N-acetyltransferase [Crocinitomix algicola]|uniref:GNAT family N-acetyltransferase n=1 Tax=Crocinitomix algicola TaxID=1740263 RepID=UPI000872C772|nr:GNAT family N-acetyltransferase [Crocinitomix algicola]
MIRLRRSSEYLIPTKDRKELYDIIITAYRLTEVEVWGHEYERISFVDYNKLIEKGEIIIAYWHNQVGGGIHYYEREPGVFVFSLLGSDFDLAGKGIGRALVEEVEIAAKENGARAIQLEILRPKGIEVPFKIRIKNWYERMGYKFTHSEDFAKVHPIKSRKLVNPSNFDYYWKDLG